MCSTRLITAHNFRMKRDVGFSEVSCEISSDGTWPKKLWFRISSESAATTAVEFPDWALLALLYPAMFKGYDLAIDASLSPSLLFNVKNDLQHLLCAYNCRLKRVRVSADNASRMRPMGPGVATGFSGGIDSFSTLKLYNSNTTPEALKTSHLSVFNVGAFGDTNTVQKEFLEKCDTARYFAKKFSLETIFVNSNLSDLYEDMNNIHFFQETHTLRNAAAALACQGSIGHYLYSSAYPYKDIGIDAAQTSSRLDTAYLDPLLLPLVSTESLAFISAGAGLSRVQKTELLGDEPHCFEELEVCVSPFKFREQVGYKNCSRCWKCIRTIATLEAQGNLDKFSAVFDVKHFRHNRDNILANLVLDARSGSTLDSAVVELLRSKGFDLPYAKSYYFSIRRKLRPLKRLSAIFRSE